MGWRIGRELQDKGTVQGFTLYKLADKSKGNNQNLRTGGSRPAGFTLQLDQKEDLLFPVTAP